MATDNVKIEKISYVKVVDEDNEEPIELPAEPDGSLLLSTLSAQFPGACGLKYRNSDTGTFRGLRIDDAGKIMPPNPEDGWNENTFIAVFPKENTKRKMDDHNVDASGATKLKRIERKKCSDLIVLGLPYKTTEEELREYFEQFGEVLVSQVKRDPKSNKSKGFGFIRFADYDSQLKVLSQRHNIDGRWCDVKIPNSKNDSSNPLSRKIFVGRISESMQPEDLREFFCHYGEVTDVFIPRPFRGFGFVTFHDANIAESLCGEDYVVKGCSVHVSPAVPKETGHGGGGGGGSHSGGGPMMNQHHHYQHPINNNMSSSNSSSGRSHYHRHGHRSSPPSEQISPQSKMSRQQVWAAFPPSNMSMNPGYGTNPWNVGQPNRSATPVPPPQAPAQPAQSAASATNQATVGMGALNLGSFMNPAVLAAAQVALLNSLTGGGSDLATLLNSLQTTNQLNNSSVASSGMGAGSGLTSAAWWPTPSSSSVGSQSIGQGNDMMNNGGGGGAGGGAGSRSQGWNQNEDWH